MSALPLRRYRVLATETRTLRTFVDAKHAAQAQAKALALWDQDGDESFQVVDANFDEVFVAKEPE